MMKLRAAAVFLSFAFSVSAQPVERYEMALTGDSIITRKLSVYQEPEFLRMIDLIRGADLAFTNIEMLFHDYESFPMASSGGTYMRAQPELAKELAWAGFDLGSLANNHSGDYGPGAMLLTERYVREAGLVGAGVGESLAEAREAKFLETAKARIAFVSLASTFPEHALAGKSRDDVPARPGLNPLRHRITYEVTREQLEALRRIMADLGMAPPERGDSLQFRREKYVAAERPRIVTEPEPEDVEEIGVVIRNASRLADFTIVSIHAHESGTSREEPAQFLVTFARRMIDEGADVFVGHGPHVLRGIEIYKGKPIFYSLGDFIFQNETLQRLPYENYAGLNLGEDKGLADFNDARYDFDQRGFPANPEIWEAVVASPVFQGEELVELRLHPITLGFGKPRQVRGRPMFADDALSEKIIKDLQERSRPFGTEIDFVDGIGVVRLASRTTN
ncbi:MAG TPA: CapA family protein [Vicinamibacteria bacterium]|nr:CapA family protein [Vicinamibacteria bacterium]